MVSPKKEKKMTATQMFMRFAFDYMPSHNQGYMGYYKNRKDAQTLIKRAISQCHKYGIARANERNFVECCMEMWGTHLRIYGFYRRLIENFLWVPQDAHRSRSRLWRLYLQNHVEGSYRSQWRTGKNTYRIKQAW